MTWTTGVIGIVSFYIGMIGGIFLTTAYHNASELEEEKEDVQGS